MRAFLSTASAVCLLVSPALAEPLWPQNDRHNAVQPAPVANATATGTGVGIANSSSKSGAVAISGQGGQGGQGGSSSSSLTINNPANTTSTVNSNISGTTTQNQNISGTTTSNVNQNVSGKTTQNINQRVSGTTNQNTNANVNQNVGGTTTVRNVPSMVAPGLTSAGLETCLGSASGTVSAVGFGIGGGSTYKDEDCTARLDSRTLFAMGLKAAAVARLCQRADIWRSMPDICQQYWPPGLPLPYGVAVGYPEGYVAPARYGRVSALMSTTPPVARMGGSSIEVVDGKTGLTRPCDDYNAVRLKCMSWADAPKRTVDASKKLNPTPTVKLASATPHRPKKTVAAPTVATVTPASAPAFVEP